MKLCGLLLITWAVCISVYGEDLPHHRKTRQSGSGNRCRSPETCVNIRSCPPLLKLLREQGRNPQVAASLRQKHCGTDGGTPKVCCSSSPPSGSPSPSSLSSSSDSPRSNVPLQQAQQSDFSECGVSDKKVSRIVGGQNASLGSWPWMVGLGYRSPTNPGPDFRCGATLISKQWVITAAHCVRGIGNFELSIARMGDLNLDKRVEDGASPIDIPVDQIISHPQFSTNPFLNDIALIHLRNPVQYTAKIRRICLLSGPEYRSDEYYNPKQPFIIGWGATGWGEVGTTILQEASVRIVNRTNCAKKYEKQSNARINERVLCAAKIGVDACQGDSGGPLIFVNPDGRFYLGGIVSYGIGCATDYPGVYTRVVEFIDWVNQVTGERF